MAVLAGAEPFSHDGGRVGVLLCHGFTGSPQSLRPWAEHLVAQGHTVRLPRLPGHGTTWQEMNRTTWQDWFGCVESELLELAPRVDTLVVAGLSMGGCLTLRLAIEHPDLVDGLVLVNPAVRLEDPRLVALPLLRRVVGSLPGIASDIKKPQSTELAYDRTPLTALASLLQLNAGTVARLHEITAPILLFRSPEDHVVPPSNSRLVLTSVASTEVEEVLCPDSYHVATLDNDAETIFERSAQFVRSVAASTPATDRGATR